MDARPINLVVGALLASANGDTFDMFGLWNDCKPVNLLPQGPVAGLNKKGERIARRKLHAMDLYDKTGRFLVLRIHVLSTRKRQPFNVSAHFLKPMIDLVSGTQHTGESWSSTSLGWDTINIERDIAKKVDWFIQQYLRVNRDSCEKRHPTR